MHLEYFTHLLKTSVPIYKIVLNKLHWFQVFGKWMFFHRLTPNYKLGISTISKIVKKVSITIWDVMLTECIPLPTKNKWELIATEFESRANFPYCLGAVDDKHIRITNPLGSMYHNYKGYSSVVLMAVADANYRFVYADIESYGKDCDSTVFKRSSLWKSIINNEQEIPTKNDVAGIENHQLPYFFVGDEAFALHKRLLRPFGGTQLSEEKRIFNYRLELGDMWNALSEF